jgi:hypothetical protein
MGMWKVTHLELPVIPGRFTPGTPAKLVGISCPSVSVCVGFDDFADLVTSTNPTGGASEWRLTKGPAAISAIACPSTTRCIAVDYQGHAISLKRSTGGFETLGSVPIDPETKMLVNVATLPAVACSSVSFCLALSYYGNAIAGLTIARRVHALLRAAITPEPVRSRIDALLRNKGLSLPFNSPRPGRLAVKWLLQTRRLGRKTSTVIIASASRGFTGQETATVRLALTPRGVALLKHSKGIRLMALGLFTLSRHHLIRVEKPFVLSR